MINFFLNCPRFVRKILAIICDILLSFIALWIAFSLRLEQFHNINEKNFIIYIFSAFLLIILLTFLMSVNCQQSYRRNQVVVSNEDRFPSPRIVVLVN